MGKKKDKRLDKRIKELENKIIEVENKIRTLSLQPPVYSYPFYNRRGQCSRFGCYCYGNYSYSGVGQQIDPNTPTPRIIDFAPQPSALPPTGTTTVPSSSFYQNLIATVIDDKSNPGCPGTGLLNTIDELIAEQKLAENSMEDYR
jgi:hypothetical protein